MCEGRSSFQRTAARESCLRIQPEQESLLAKRPAQVATRNRPKGKVSGNPPKQIRPLLFPQTITCPKKERAPEVVKKPQVVPPLHMVPEKSGQEKSVRTRNFKDLRVLQPKRSFRRKFRQNEVVEDLVQASGGRHERRVVPRRLRIVSQNSRHIRSLF